MNLRQEDLLNLSKNGLFRAEMLEKVIWLTEVLNEIFDNSFLKQRLVLKGGTALNLFYLNMPRLSVDIDLNYIGSLERSTMLMERQELENILTGICRRLGLNIKRSATEHAGGKWRLNFASAVQPSGTLEIDLSYLYRTTLYPIKIQNSYQIGLYQAKNIAVLDIHELAAGKLTALMSRHASRDLYDTHQLANIFEAQKLNKEQLRLAFIVFGGASQPDWRKIKIESINFDHRELMNNLLPVINQNYLKDFNQKEWTNKLITDSQQFLSLVLPFSDQETLFLDKLLNEGKIVSSLITQDPTLQENFQSSWITLEDTI